MQKREAILGDSGSVLYNKSFGEDLDKIIESKKGKRNHKK